MAGLDQRLAFTQKGNDVSSREWEVETQQPEKKRGTTFLTSQSSSSGGTNVIDKSALNRELNSLKMIANNAQKIRLLSSAVYWSIMLPFTLLEPALQVGKAFAEKYKGDSGHKAGSPHVRVWKSFLMTILDTVKSKTSEIENGQDKNNLTNARNTSSDTTADSTADIW